MRRALIVLGLLLAAGVAWFALQSEDRDPPVPRASADPGRAEEARGGGREGPVLQGSAADPVGSRPSEVGPGSGHRVTGRVLDDRRRPVAGARVAVLQGQASLAEGTSGPDGDWVLAIGPRAAETRTLRLVARIDGRVARRRHSLAADAPEVIRVAPLVLRKAETLPIRVVRDGAAVPGAEVAILDSDDYGLTTVPLLVRADGEGRAEVEDLLPGVVRVFAGAEGLGRAMTEGTLPATSPIVVDLPADRTLLVRVVKGRPSGAGEEPVAGAEVFLGDRWLPPAPQGTGVLPPLPPLRTDAEGTVLVRGLPAGPLLASARAEGLALPSMGYSLVHVPVPPEATEVTVLLRPWQRLEFPARAGDVDPPEEGTHLEVVPFQRTLPYDRSAPTARMVDGRVVIEGLAPGHGLGRVVAPDGVSAEWQIALGPDLLAREPQDEVRFFSPRDLTIRLTESGGLPASDAWIRLRLSPRGGAGPARTDASGHVTFPRLAGTLARVFWSPTEDGFGEHVADVHLVPPPGVTEIEVPALLRLRLRVTVEGEARLPPSYVVSVGERSMAPSEATEDAERGELTLLCRPRVPDEGLPVTLRVPGYPPAEAVLPSGAGRDHVLDLAVGAPSRVTVRVTRPEDGRYMLFVERWDEAGGRWFLPEDDAALVQVRRGTADGLHVLEGARPGRYRLHDVESGELSPPFEVRSGETAREIPFDLGDVAAFEGRVVVPEGESGAFAKVFVRDGGDAGAFPARGTIPAADGRFPVRARRGGTVPLRVTHPVLRAADPAGRDFVAGRDELVLRLERGPEIRFRVPGVETTTEAPDPRILTVGDAGWRVLAASPGTSWKEARSLAPIAVGGLWRAGLPAPGTYDLWIDLRGRTPVVLRGVDVGEGPAELGTLDVGAGSVLRLRLSTRGRDVSRLPLVVEHLGEPAYQRSPAPVGEPAGDVVEVLVPGLGSGRFRVRLYDPTPPRPGSSPGPLLDRTIEVDGRGEVILEASLP